MIAKGLILETAEMVENKIAPVYYKYPNQLNPQPAYITVTLDSIDVDYTPNAKGWCPMQIYRGDWTRIAIPSATKGAELSRFLKENVDIISNLLESDNKSELITKLELEVIELEQANIWDARDWLEDDLDEVVQKLKTQGVESTYKELLEDIPTDTLVIGLEEALEEILSEVLEKEELERALAEE